MINKSNEANVIFFAYALDNNNGKTLSPVHWSTPSRLIPASALPSSSDVRSLLGPCLKDLKNKPPKLTKIHYIEHRVSASGSTSRNMQPPMM